MNLVTAGGGGTKQLVPSNKNPKATNKRAKIMTKLITNVSRSLKRVHQTEEGMEALQTVLIMALATVVLSFAYKMMSGDGSGTGSGGGLIGNIGDLIGGGISTIANKVTGLLK